jgi:hypothetical protein
VIFTKDHLSLHSVAKWISDKESSVFDQAQLKNALSQYKEAFAGKMSVNGLQQNQSIFPIQSENTCARFSQL